MAPSGEGLSATAPTCRRHTRPAARSPPTIVRELDGLEYLVLDEADRMLDMGFLPDVRRIVAHARARGTRSCSARRCRRGDHPALTGEILEVGANKICLQRTAAPAAGVTPGDLPGGHRSSSPGAAPPQLLKTGAHRGAGLHADKAPRPDRVARYLNPARHLCGFAIHGNRSQAQRTKALEELQERALPRAGRHRHRGAGDRRRGARGTW